MAYSKQIRRAQIIFIAVGTVVFGLLAWGLDVLLHSGPYADHKPLWYGIVYYALKLTVFGFIWYFLWLFVVRIKGTATQPPVPFRSWASIWPKLLIIAVVYVVALFILDAFVR